MITRACARVGVARDSFRVSADRGVQARTSLTGLSLPRGTCPLRVVGRRPVLARGSNALRSPGGIAPDLGVSSTCKVGEASSVATLRCVRSDAWSWSRPTTCSPRPQTPHSCVSPGLIQPSRGALRSAADRRPRQEAPHPPRLQCAANRRLRVSARRLRGAARLPLQWPAACPDARRVRRVREAGPRTGSGARAKGRSVRR